MMSHLPVRLCLYDAGGTKLGNLVDAFDIEVSCSLNDTSTLSFSYPRGGHLAEWLIPISAAKSLAEVAVQIATPGGTNGTSWWEPAVGRFLIEAGTHDFESAGRADIIKLSLTGIATRLSDAVVLPDSSAANVEANKGNRVFTNATVGTVLRTIIDEAINRGWGKDLDLTGVDTSRDVLGTQWAKTTEISIAGGTTIRKVLDDLVDRDLIDWRFSGRRLLVYNRYNWGQLGDTIGVRRDKTSVVLPLIKDSYTTASDSFDWGERAQKIFIEGEESKTWTYSTPVSSTPGTLNYNLGQRHKELYVKSQGLTSSGQADILAQQYIVQGMNRVDELKRTYNVEVLSAQPLYHLLPGDVVTCARTWTALNGSTEQVMIEGLHLSWSGTSCTVDVTLGRSRESLIRKLSRVATTTDNGVRVTSVAGSPFSGAKAKTSPTAAQPTLSVSQTLDAYGVPYAVVTVTAVTRDKDGNSLPSEGEVRYEVQYRQASASAGWVSLGTTSNNVAELTGLAPATSYQVRARATFYSADRYTIYGGYNSEPPSSQWSSTSTFTTGQDSTAPPIPSLPIVTSEFRSAQISWDGMGANGLNGEPEDFSHLNVALVMTSAQLTVTHRIDKGMGHELAVAGLSEGDYDVAFQAVDINGNASAWSGRTTFTSSSTVDAEAIQRTVDEALEQYEATVGKAVALANSVNAIANQVVIEGWETPPSEGAVDTSYWKGPDGQWWVLREAPAS